MDRMDRVDRVTATAGPRGRGVGEPFLVFGDPGGRGRVGLLHGQHAAWAFGLELWVNTTEQVSGKFPFW